MCGPKIWKKKAKLIWIIIYLKNLSNSFDLQLKYKKIKKFLFFKTSNGYKNKQSTFIFLIDFNQI